MKKLSSLKFVTENTFCCSGPTEPSIKLKKITRNQNHFKSSKSYDPTDFEQLQRSFKDLDCFR